LDTLVDVLPVVRTRWLRPRPVTARLAGAARIVSATEAARYYRLTPAGSVAADYTLTSPWS
jgi:hypothetical protein